MNARGLIVAGCLLSACNGVFYQPDSVERLTPRAVDLPYQDHPVRTADRQKLATWRIAPKSGPTRGTVIHFHGNAENMSTHFLSSAWLAENGYTVVTFDYRGYGRSEGHPDREGLIEDGRAVLKDVLHDPVLGRSPVVIFAQSLGGAVAVPVVAGLEERAQIRGLVLDSTFASYRGITRAKLAALWLTWPLQWPLSFLVSDAWSARDRIGEVTCPILIVHAEEDPVVPFEQGQALFEAAPTGSEFWPIHGGGHIATFQKGSPFRTRLLGRLASWTSTAAQK